MYYELELLAIPFSRSSTVCGVTPVLVYTVNYIFIEINSMATTFSSCIADFISDLAYLVEEAEAETEVFGSSLLLLQRRLNFAKASAQVLAAEVEQLDPGLPSRVFQEMGWSPFDEAEDRLVDQESDTSIQDIGDGPQVEIGSPAVSDRSASLSTHSEEEQPSSSTPLESPIRLKRTCSRTCSVSSSSGNLSHMRFKRRRSDPESAGRSSLINTVPCSNPHVNSPPSIPVDGPQRTFSSNRGSLTSDNEDSFGRTRSSSPGQSWEQDDSNLSSMALILSSKIISESEGDSSRTRLPMPTNGQISFDST